MIYWGDCSCTQHSENLYHQYTGQMFLTFLPNRLWRKMGAIVHTTTIVPFADAILVAYVILPEGPSNNRVGHGRVKIEQLVFEEYCLGSCLKDRLIRQKILCLPLVALQSKYLNHEHKSVKKQVFCIMLLLTVGHTFQNV